MRGMVPILRNVDIITTRETAFARLGGQLAGLVAQTLGLQEAMNVRTNTITLNTMLPLTRERRSWPGQGQWGAWGTESRHTDRYSSELQQPLKSNIMTYSRLDVAEELSSREVGTNSGGEGRGNREDLRAIDESAVVNAEDSKAAEHIRERLLELLLISGERLPLACGPVVAGDQEVGLEAHLTAERGRDLTPPCVTAGERGTLELRLDEELRVEDSGSGVERRARDGGVNEVGSGDGVRGKQPDNLKVLETNIEETSQDLINRVCKSGGQCGYQRARRIAKPHRMAQERDRRAQPVWHPCGRA